MADDENILLRLLKEKQAMQRATILSPANTDMEKLQKILALKQYIKDTENTISRMIENTNDSEYSKKLRNLKNEKLQRIENRIAELAKSMNPVTLEMLNQKLNELDDKQIIKYAEDFLKLPEEEQAKLFLSRGAFKNTFDLPGTNYVLKTVANPMFAIDFPRDYIQHRMITEQARRYSKNPEFIKNIVEQPMLVRVPEAKKEVLIQKKIIPIESVVGDRHINYDDLDAYKKYQDYIEEINKTFPEEDLRPTDIAPRNVGIDPKTGKIKSFDVMVPERQFNESVSRSRELVKKLKELSESTLLKGLADSDFGKASLKFLPILGGAAFAAKKMLPIVGFGGSFKEAKDEGMSTPAALAYALAEEANPTPISALEMKAGLEGLGGLIRDAIYTGDKDSMFPSPEAQGEKLGLENYKKAKLAREKEAANNRQEINFPRLRSTLKK